MPVFHVKHVSEVRFLVRGHHTVLRVSFRHLADRKHQITQGTQDLTCWCFTVRYVSKRDPLNGVVTSDKETELKKRVLHGKLTLEVSCLGSAVPHGRDTVFTTDLHFWGDE